MVLEAHLAGDAGRVGLLFDAARLILVAEWLTFAFTIEIDKYRF